LKIDLVYLRRHYASLSDEGLLAIDETELVNDARRIYDEELAERGLTFQEETEESDDGAPGLTPRPSAPRPSVPRPLVPRQTGRPDDDHAELVGGPEPVWLEDAASPASFVSRPGGEAAQQAAAARDALQAAGIPVYVWSGDVEPQPDPPKQHEFRVMVPDKWMLEAQSVLDQEIFNREVEDQWKTHFQMLSDEELRSVDPQVLFGGLTDRIERVTRAYRDELAEREITPPR
jgi:hypothetical protein